VRDDGAQAEETETEPQQPGHNSGGNRQQEPLGDVDAALGEGSDRRGGGDEGRRRFEQPAR
jgi:hypothetical protein